VGERGARAAFYRWCRARAISWTAGRRGRDPVRADPVVPFDRRGARWHRRAMAARLVHDDVFRRLYREAFRKTPHEDLVDVRLERARGLLGRDQAGVTEVCLAVGFSSLGSFSTLFSRRMGCAPSAYRRRVWHYRDAFGEAALVIPYCYLWRPGGSDGGAGSQSPRSGAARGVA